MISLVLSGNHLQNEWDAYQVLYLIAPGFKQASTQLYTRDGFLPRESVGFVKAPDGYYNIQ